MGKLRPRGEGKVRSGFMHSVDKWVWGLGPLLNPGSITVVVGGPAPPRRNH